MKLCFDTDGTMTDFEKFIKNNAIPHFKKLYGMEIINEKGLEIEEIFDIKNVLMSKGYDEKTALKKEKEMLDKFWVSFNFVKFSLLLRFRSRVAKTIREFKKDGLQIDIDTSRAKTCNNDIIGKIARTFTLTQYKLNGVFVKKENINFYENDDAKINGVKEKGEVILFDDKPIVIDKVTTDSKVKCVCVNTKNNEDFNFDLKKVVRIDGFENNQAKDAVKKLIGERRYDALKRAHKSDKVYKPAISIFGPIIMKKFSPIIIGEEKVLTLNEPIIYAPNHVSTIDPLVLTAYFSKNIRWAALKRFFDGTDSIFNNSKNYILCKITSTAFKKMEFFPIERKVDNPNANNFEAIRDMNAFLKNSLPVGIFPEGTTNKELDVKDFNEFDDAFLRLAKRSDAWVQPITSLWIKELNIKEKVIIKIGEPFKVDNMTIDQAMSHYLRIQKENLLELKTIRTVILMQEDLKLEGSTKILKNNY